MRSPGFTFRFDSSACSGCKACQVACKDRNGLEPGVLWRRVYEVAGGGWRQRGPAWISDVFAYHLSVGCNHCEQPICIEVCPAGAFRRREDGLVLLDSNRCLGCRLCAWSCPYGAPQFDEKHGRMTKCDFCAEEIDTGGSPACVNACPMRALEFRRPGCATPVPESPVVTLPEPYPLPCTRMMRPCHVISRHPEAERARTGQARIANAEEVGRS
jgi:anaerobic dimethyl sulfoxide reductase subunit B